MEERGDTEGKRQKGNRTDREEETEGNRHRKRERGDTQERRERRRRGEGDTGERHTLEEKNWRGEGKRQRGTDISEVTESREGLEETEG